MYNFGTHFKCGGRVWRAPALLLAVAVVLSACGGADNASSPNTISASTGGAQARVVSAAQLPVTVRAAQDSAGAPPLPTDALEPLGAIQQFTPMGLTAPGLSIAVPFNPQLLDSGAQPRLLVAQPGGEWTLVADARVEQQDNTSLLVAAVPQLGYAVVVQVPAELAAEPASGGKVQSAGTSVRITSGQPLVSLQLQSSQPALAPQPEGADLFRVGQPTTLVQSVRVDFNTACAPQVRVYGVLAKMVGDQLNTQVFTLASRAYPVGSTSAAFTATHTLDAAHNGSYATFASATCTRTVGGSWANQVLSRVPAVALGQYFDVNMQAPVALPQITQAPQNASVTEGSTASFGVGASGAAPLAYQWQRSDNGSDWANVPGATGANLSFIATLADHGSLWRVIVSNASGQATSAPAQLSVTQQLIAPSISSQPQNQTVVEGQNASFSLAASGQPAPAIQWQTRMLDATNTETGWADIPGATQASYTTPATTLADHQRQFRARISNSAGSLNSAAATLSVSARLIAPSITQQPVGAEVIEGASADFTVAAGGSTPLSYQWFKDGVALVGANGAAVSIPTGAADAGKTIAITVRVSNGAGQVTSQAASLVVTAADTGTVSGLINAGEGGSLSTANGAATLDVPAGALSGDATLTLRTQAPSDFTLPEGFTPVSDVITVGLDGGVLVQPLSISFPNPAALPPGTVLALAELVPSGSGARKAFGARVRAQAIAANDALFGVPPEAYKGGLVNLGLTDTSKALVLGAVDVLALGGKFAMASNDPRWDLLPGTRESACTGTAEFKPLNPAESASDLTQLHSRHVACGEGYSHLVGLSLSATAGGTPTTSTGERVLSWQWAVSGPSSGLEKSIDVTFSYKRDPGNPGPDGVAPALKVRPLVRCSVAGVNEAFNPSAVNCGLSSEVINLNDGQTGKFHFSMPVSWDTSAGKKIAEFNMQLQVYLTTDGSAPNVSSESNASGFTSLGTLRCDDGQVWGTSKGCVFPQAAAVLVLKDTPQSAQHMREALAVNPAMPGRYAGLRPGTRAVAIDVPGLQRLRVASLINANRSKIQKVCAALPSPPPSGGSCPLVTDANVDTDAALEPCDCDEYPFASSRDGAAMPRTYGEASAKYIGRSDNRKAGAQLGAMLRRERIFDPYDHKRFQAKAPVFRLYDLAISVDGDGNVAFDVSKDVAGQVRAINSTGGGYSYELDFDERYWIAF